MARATPWALALFFAAAAVLLIVAGITLLAPGGPLDAVWLVAEEKHARLTPYAGLIGPAFFLLAIVMAITALGCAGRRRWGWWLAVIALAVNGIGDASEMLAGRVAEGLFGVVAAALVLAWLTRRPVRAEFPRGDAAVF